MTQSEEYPHVSFKRTVGRILKLYYSGLYFDARHLAQTSSEDYESVSWECRLLSAISRTLQDWDPAASFAELTYDLSVVSGQAAAAHAHKFKLFHTWLIQALFCCRESGSWIELQTALHAVNDAILLHSDEGFRNHDQIAFWEEHAEGESTYYPRDWSVYWFRGVARSHVGLSGPAGSDLRRAVQALREDTVRAAVGLEHGAGLPRREIALGLRNILRYCKGNYKGAGRFLHDVALFAFDNGDWGLEEIDGTRSQWGHIQGLPLRFGASQIMSAAAEIDEHNSYIRANLGSILNISHQESASFYELSQAWNSFEAMEAQGNNVSRSWFGSGKTYFQSGLLAYKYHALSSITDRERELIEGQLASDSTPESFKQLFISKDRALLAFERAARHYQRTRDIFKALTAAYLSTDPLDFHRIHGDTSAVSARHLLLSLSFGMGSDVVANLIQHEQLVREHFAGDRA